MRDKSITTVPEKENTENGTETISAEAINETLPKLMVDTKPELWSITNLKQKKATNYITNWWKPKPKRKHLKEDKGKDTLPSKTQN